jgi:hypothetical protein
MMRKISAAILATTMLGSSAFAADNAPLAPGKPAGTKNAQGAGSWVGPLLLGSVVVGLITYTVIYSQNHKNNGLSSGGTIINP